MTWSRFGLILVVVGVVMMSSSLVLIALAATVLKV